jgi:hypothetical protein
MKFLNGIETDRKLRGVDFDGDSVVVFTPSTKQTAEYNTFDYLSDPKNRGQLLVMSSAIQSFKRQNLSDLIETAFRNDIEIRHSKTNYEAVYRTRENLRKFIVEAIKNNLGIDLKQEWRVTVDNDGTKRKYKSIVKNNQQDAILRYAIFAYTKISHSQLRMPNSDLINFRNELDLKLVEDREKEHFLTQPILSKIPLPKTLRLSDPELFNFVAQSGNRYRTSIGPVLFAAVEYQKAGYGFRPFRSNFSGNGPQRRLRADIFHNRVSHDYRKRSKVRWPEASVENNARALTLQTKDRFVKWVWNQAKTVGV